MSPWCHVSQGELKDEIKRLGREIKTANKAVDAASKVSCAPTPSPPHCRW